MSRMGAPRSLSLTEELERLEQQITLTLQEIDSNFSKAHRIVTGSILPIVEQYGRHSSDVWEGSKFWKQFFEASANVSLSGYEEAALDQSGVEDDTTDATHTDTTATLETPEQHTASGANLQSDGEDEDEFSVDSPTQVTGVNSTPKLSASTGKSSIRPAAPSATKKTTSFRSPSPRKYTGRNPLAIPSSTTSGEPSTPRPHAQASLGADSSPFQPNESAYRPSTIRTGGRANNNDALLHRGVLDKNYRIQATPHTQRRQNYQRQAGTGATKATPATATKASKLWDDSPESSPAIMAPQLRSDLFSPVGRAPRTPGVSVLTPARGKATATAPTTSTGRKLFSPDDKAYNNTQQSRTAYTFADDSDDDDDDGLGGMSPPKTMQFHVPQSRLLQTPAREASRKIVEDLLLTAGADNTDDIEYGDGDEEGAMEEPSPSVVRRAFDVDEDTF